jgi:N-acetylneuraminic acid mutarotase
VINTELFVIERRDEYSFWKVDLLSFSTALTSSRAIFFSEFSWQQLPSPPDPRDSFACAALNNDMIIIAGGVNSSLVHSFVLSQNRWISLPSMSRRRSDAAAVFFNSVTVLMIGGLNASGHRLSSCEEYNAANGQWRDIDSLQRPRAAHSAVLLEDGRVMVMGGFGSSLDHHQQFLCSPAK